MGKNIRMWEKGLNGKIGKRKKMRIKVKDGKMPECGEKSVKWKDWGKKK